MTKIIQALNELEQHWAVMKHSPGMPPGANTINPAVIEGDVILLLLLMNVVYGLRFIIYRMKVMTTLQRDRSVFKSCCRCRHLVEREPVTVRMGR